MAVLALVLAFTSARGGPDALATAEDWVTRWSQLRAEAGRIESEWQWQRRVLQATQEALDQQVRRLQSDLQLERAAQHDRQRASAARQEENRAQQAALSEAERDLQALSARALALQRRLPPRLAAAVELPARSLADPSLPVADRMQHLATFQSRCQQFNRVATYSEEVLVPPGGQEPRLLEILYWGLAAAYALDRERDAAYLGRPAARGWVWEPLPGAAADVAQLLAVQREAAPPAFVHLPLQLQLSPAVNAEENR